MTSVAIIDDSPLIVETVARALRKKFPHINLIKLINPEDLLQYKSADVDLVISDQVMPEMTGVDLIKKFRGEGALHHDIIVTGSLEEVPGILRGDQKRSPIQVFTKPINMPIFLEYVRAIIEG